MNWFNFAAGILVVVLENLAPGGLNPQETSILARIRSLIDIAIGPETPVPPGLIKS